MVLSLAPSTSAFTPGIDGYSGPLPTEQNDVVIMTGLQIAMSRELGGWPLYTIIIAAGQMLSATSFQITLLSGQNWQTDLQLYVLGGVFLASSIVWYVLFRYRPSVYVLSAPWLFFAIAFFLIGLPSVASALHGAHDILTSLATWSYAVASAAAFLFFGLNFGEEAVSAIVLNSCCPLTLCLGCRYGSLDDASCCSSRFSADLGCSALVLG